MVELSFEEKQRLKKIGIVNSIIKITSEDRDQPKLKKAFEELASLYEGNWDELDWWVLMVIAN